MPRRYLAFDIETAREFPDGVDWRRHRPLGITCAATQADGEEPRCWHSNSSGKPSPTMSRSDLVALVAYLVDCVEQGFTLVTWNGLSFDFDVLAEESGEHEKCESLALDHVDMMFHVVCEKGYPIKLEAVSTAMGLGGKAGGIQGIQAPTLWRSGEHDAVLQYVKKDVALTCTIARRCEQLRRAHWRSQKGRPMELSLPDGWLSVQRANQLPLPDTSWMATPLRRQDFVSWIRPHTIITAQR